MITPDIRQAKHMAIAEQLLTAHDWSMVRRLHMYTSMPQEVDTQLIRRLLAIHHPHIAIETSAITATAATPSVLYDVIIVPILGYTVTGNRLGQGSGWYDTFLAEQPTARRIGLGYRECQVAYIPVEKHDQSLDFIIAA